MKLSPLTSTFVTKQTKTKILTKLRIPQIGYILAVVIRIIRNLYYGMPASRGDRVIFLSGTCKADKVVMKDLNFWLPHTKSHLCDGVQYTPSFEALT